MNPFLVSTAFIPDGEPHIYKYKNEERVFLYGSTDSKISTYCGPYHEVWSAPLTDLTHWTNHGIIFQGEQIFKGAILGAPDCAYNPITNKYYLYTFVGNWDKDKKEPRAIVAVSDSPVGPFLHPKTLDWPAANDRGIFDPAVLVDQDDNGNIKVYAYWGMLNGGARWARLDPEDMYTIIDGETGKPDLSKWHETLQDVGKNKCHPGFFEASSIRKIQKGKYVFIYSSTDKNSALTYCYSNSPEGPWILGTGSGRIIDNFDGWIGGNNHGSIIKIRDRWYVFYHRQNGIGLTANFSRQACMEPISLQIIREQVCIEPVTMSSQGSEITGLPAFRQYNASVFCRCSSGAAYIDGKQRHEYGLNPVTNIANNTQLHIRYMDFGDKQFDEDCKLVLKLRIKLKYSFTLKVFLKKETSDSIKTINIGEFNIGEFLNIEDNYHDISLPLINMDKVHGRNEVLFLFNGDSNDNYCDIQLIEFSKSEQQTINPLLNINMEETIKKLIKVVPTKARTGESVIITSKIPVKLKISDANHTQSDITQNAIVPFSDYSYTFLMPETEVFIEQAE